MLSKMLDKMHQKGEDKMHQKEGDKMHQKGGDKMRDKMIKCILSFYLTLLFGGQIK